MTYDKVNWKRLFLQAHKMLRDEEFRHAAGCGCRDGEGTGSEGPCPGVMQRVRWLKRMEKVLSQGDKQ